VLDFRTLQSGGVVTGIVAAGPQTTDATDKHLVYIRRPDGAAAIARQQALKIEGECSCGTRSPCVHVAAVSIAAARSAREAGVIRSRAATASPTRPSAQAHSQTASLQHQRLYYVVERLVRETASAETRGDLHASASSPADSTRRRVQRPAR
jgi:hypothetical protein